MIHAMMPNTRRAVIKALDCMVEIFQEPGRWAQNEFARTRDGERAKVHSAKAYAFCLMGASSHCSSTKNVGGHVVNALDNAIRSNHAPFYRTNVISFNDNFDRTQDEILEVVQLARNLVTE